MCFQFMYARNHKPVYAKNRMEVATSKIFSIVMKLLQRGFLHIETKLEGAPYKIQKFNFFLHFLNQPNIYSQSLYGLPFRGVSLHQQHIYIYIQLLTQIIMAASV